MKRFKVSEKKKLEELLRSREAASYPAQEKVVREILEEVRARGNSALFEYTERFDGVRLSAATVRVQEEEMAAAYRAIDPELLRVIRRSADNIRAFHEQHRLESWRSAPAEGVLLGQKVSPVSRAGVYVPGGKAAYPSTVLMDVIPAKVAGVPEICVTTPVDASGNLNAAVLVAAKEAGADVVYKVGGAQAIAALAYGTESIPRADKIVGPGNIYVALAKKMVFGAVGIDSVAGPSEILVLADGTADPRFAAADLLSQAEHDELASAILVTTSEALAKSVETEIGRFLAELPRREIIERSLENFGCILLASDLEEAAEAVNAIAPEHLEILTEDPEAILAKIRNAGAIFLGPYSCEPLGDYFAGPNHTLPTNGTARFFSPLTADDFVKRSSVIRYTREALAGAQEDIRRFASAEGLSAHANAIAVRFEEEQQDQEQQER